MPSIEFRVTVSGFMSQVICPEVPTWTGLQAMQTKHSVCQERNIKQKWHVVYEGFKDTAYLISIQAIHMLHSIKYTMNIPYNGSCLRHEKDHLNLWL